MENTISTIKERVIMFVEQKRIPKEKFFNKIGITSANFRGKAKNSPLNSTTIANIISEYPEISLDWLLTGKGEMCNQETSLDKQKTIDLSNKDEENVANSKIVAVDKKEDYRLVPLINMDTVGGFNNRNATSIHDTQFTEKLLPFVGALEGDICIPVTGNSMSPTCPLGCRVLVREVERWQEYFGYGHIYCILLHDGRRILKEIRKHEENPKEYVLCVSHNKDFPDEELPRSMIVKVWRVIEIQKRMD